jgi:DNA repair protein RadC
MQAHMASSKSMIFRAVALDDAQQLIYHTRVAPGY